MRIKSYFADSVQEAIEKARVELGAEAMLLNSKKTDFELRALGSVEVVFGLPGQTVASKPRLQIKSGGTAFAQVQSYSSASTSTTAAPSRATAMTAARLPDSGGNLSSQGGGVASGPGSSVPALSGEVAQELAELRLQIETVKRSMSRQQRTGSLTDDKPSRAIENLCSRLMAADISEDLAQEIAEAVELQAFAWKQTSNSARDFEMIPSETIELALNAEIDRRFQVCPELGLQGAKQKTVMLVGPAGAGKTTSLIKLALRYGLQVRLPMHILSLDTLRVGGWEHLASFARIAGLGVF